MKSPSSDPVRLNRYLSMCGIASRRKADDMIEAGRVMLNGTVVKELGIRIRPGVDQIFVDGAEAVMVKEPQYLVLNKPKDTITTLSDEKGRRTVIDLIRSRERVYPIGRLDRNTTGVLLFTSDGSFAHQLMHPRFRIPKSYRVRCDNPVTREHMAMLRSGVRLSDGVTGPADIRSLPGGKGTEVGITIHEGRNRQVRRMFELLGYEVKSLDRVAYGPITYEGLIRGSVRKLTIREIRALRRLALGDEE
ncbi:MAG: rRNA pseudouridine synthase [Ignavibacteria bacterium]|nr:rRNA pseudouridine synthase [Ignavibacteria bacterium]